MALGFRNVDAAPTDPVATWPQEAVAAALERGDYTHWARLRAAILADPWGPVATTVEEVLTYCAPYGAAAVMRRALTVARAGRANP